MPVEPFTEGSPFANDPVRNLGTFDDINDRAVIREGKIMAGLPKPVSLAMPDAQHILLPDGYRQRATISGRPLLLFGKAWSRAAREAGLQEDLRDRNERFVFDSQRLENWVPSQILAVVGQELIDHGSKLTPPTTNDIIVHAKTEIHVGDYVRFGLTTTKHNFSRESLVMIWGGQEDFHGDLLMRALIMSGKITRLDRLRMEADERRNPWMPEDHNGLLSVAEGFWGFGAAQEKGTHRNYLLLDGEVRADYGLVLKEGMDPEEIQRVKDIEAFERKRGLRIGMSGVLQVIARQEIKHHQVYVDDLQILARYFPDRAYDILKAVKRRFQMPLVHAIEGSDELAVRFFPRGFTDLLNFNREIFNKIGQMMGTDDFAGINRAAINAKIFEDTFIAGVAELNPDGSLIIKNDYTEIVEAIRREEAA